LLPAGDLNSKPLLIPRLEIVPVPESPLAPAKTAFMASATPGVPPGSSLTLMSPITSSQVMSPVSETSFTVASMVILIGGTFVAGVSTAPSFVSITILTVKTSVCLSPGLGCRRSTLRGSGPGLEEVDLLRRGLSGGSCSALRFRRVRGGASRGRRR